MRRNPFRAVAFVLLACLAAALPRPGAAAPKDGGTLTIGVAAKVVGFDPFTFKTNNFETAMVSGMIFGNWFTLDAEGKQVPSNALSAELLDHGKAWRLHMRPGMKYSDGSPFDAAAVAAYWTRLLDPSKNQAFAAYYANAKEMVAIDPVTAELHLAAPTPMYQPTFSANGFSMLIMPPSHVAAAGAELNRKPIGAGPYMLTEWNPDGDMTLVRNPHYWDRKAQHFDKIVVKFIPDENSRYAAVQNGDIDMAFVPFEQVRDARKNPRLQVITQKATGSFTVMFNLKVPPLDDVRVRQALAYAVDRSADRKVVFADEVEMAKGFWPKDSPFGCEVDYPEYNPDKAKALLKDYGKPVKFTLRTPTSPIGVLGGQIYQSYWKKVGVEVELAPVQLGPAYIGPVFAGSYEATLWDVPDYVDPDVQVFAPFYSKSGANLSHADSPALDDALTRGRQSIDPAVRRQAYCDFAREFARYLPALLRDQHMYALVANAKLGGITHLRYGRFWPASAWWEQ